MPEIGEGNDIQITQDSPRSFDQRFEEVSEIVLGDPKSELREGQEFSVEDGGDGVPVREESWEAPRSFDSQENGESRSSGPGSWNRLDSRIEVNRTPKIQNPVDESNQEISDLKESYPEMVNLEEGLEADNLNHQITRLANLWTNNSQATSVDNFSFEIEGTTDPTIHWGINIAVEEISKPFMALPPLAINEPTQEFHEEPEELQPQFERPKVNSHSPVVVAKSELEGMDELDDGLPGSIKMKCVDGGNKAVEFFGNLSAHKVLVKMPMHNGMQLGMVVINSGANLSNLFVAAVDGHRLNEGNLIFDPGGVDDGSCRSIVELVLVVHLAEDVSMNGQSSWGREIDLELFKDGLKLLTFDRGVIACLVEVKVDCRPEMSDAFVVVGKLFQIVSSGCWCGAERMDLYYISDCILTFDPGGVGSVFRYMRQQMGVVWRI